MVKNKKRKILTVVGARPQFIKAAVVNYHFCTAPNLNEILIHTGQHFDDNMSEVFFRDLNIPLPQHQLNINNKSHAEMTGHMLIALEKIMLQEEPNIVLVYGDTNSTLAGALAASKLNIPIAHVEAGLRSFNKSMPEEINRVLVDQVSAIYFCPTFRAVENLKNENIMINVHHVGDVMYDMVQHFKNKLNSKQFLNAYNLSFGKYIFLTIHREANVIEVSQLRDLLHYVYDYAKHFKHKILFPVHPRTKKRIDTDLCQKMNDSLIMVDPLGYFETQVAIMNAQSVFTDSGGVQKEAYFHRVPCVTLRDETEWVETIERGWNRLWKVPQYIQPRQEIYEYGDGNAAFNIVNMINDYLN
ncbi:non-hydrolyzing UDP-N-acetylglucosamine 2-epimerase [Candidatus Coxiella mudrowiae]|uniref:UDP-N-acetylglucosamine 2-epimerase n=1 Tax=Candidatus Coxiella mudrowiae TaxID=2054173 RepID=A0ABM5UUU0_9COXI|nr:UDP-N-acetylglucosamine 2-epimerase (non-hydrolyzing) [Candidatus Coxiella mudrowiae]AKQ33746.1 UDP-N-acetylglucosamine 2-epimerase [Candidatus Coxiella mudrowiae]